MYFSRRHTIPITVFTVMCPGRSIRRTLVAPSSFLLFLLPKCSGLFNLQTSWMIWRYLNK